MSHHDPTGSMHTLFHMSTVWFRDHLLRVSLHQVSPPFHLIPLLHRFLLFMIPVIHPPFLLILRQPRCCPHHLACPIDLTVLRHSPTPSMPPDGLVFYNKLRPWQLALPCTPLTPMKMLALVPTLRIALLVLSTTGASSSCVVLLSMLVPAWPKNSHYSLTKHYHWRRFLDPADRAILVQRSALFLHGLYRPHSSSMQASRAKIVYVCALAMTFLFQPEPRDNRMIHEFHCWW